MMNNKTIYFDMDGTIANLYAVDEWLNKIINSDSTPYAQARPMVNMNSLARILNRLQRNGYYIGIVSWLSKSGTDEYNAEVTRVKKEWLNRHLKSVQWNEITIVPYGTPKSTAVVCNGGILFDDELNNRNEWNGIAYDIDNIIEILKRL